MNKKKEILFLINPLANEERSQVMWDQVAKRFSHLRPRPVDIRSIENLSAYIKEKNPQIVAIIGGDGTINSVCAAVLPMAKKPLLAVIPLGFGNALSYCLGVETIEKSLAVLKKPTHTLAIDVMHTNLSEESIGIFNISIGFDARIVHARMNDRYIGLRSYVLSAIKSIVTHPEKKLTITIDDNFVIRATASALVVANSPVIGQNYMVAPHARMNDGKLDCTLFSSKYAYLTNLRFKGFKHPLYSEMGKVHFKAQKIAIDGDPLVQIDGDPFVKQGGITISILPRAITFLRNSLDNIEKYHEPFLTDTNE